MNKKLQADSWLNDIATSLGIKIQVGVRKGLVDVEYTCEWDQGVSTMLIEAATYELAIHEICHWMTSSPDQREMPNYDLSSSMLEIVEEPEQEYDEDDEPIYSDLVPLTEMWEHEAIMNDNNSNDRREGVQGLSPFAVRESHVRELMAVMLEYNVVCLADRRYGYTSEQEMPYFIAEGMVASASCRHTMPAELQEPVFNALSSYELEIDQMARLLAFIEKNELDRFSWENGTFGGDDAED